MRRLSENDGGGRHKKAGNYHIGACTEAGQRLHTALASEMEERVSAQKTAERTLEDAADAHQASEARTDFAEVELENVVRDIDSDLGRADRANPQLGARAAVFPNGFGPVIDLEGKDQLEPLAGLKVRLRPFAALPEVAPDVARLEAAEATFRVRVTEEAAAADHVKTLEAGERATRRAIREQMESAYGRLRDFYKASPAQTERFFHRGFGSRRTPPTPTTPPA